MPTDRERRPKKAAPGKSRRPRRRTTKKPRAAAAAAQAAKVEARPPREDRRESPRLPIKVMVKNAETNQFEEVAGDISLGGMHFVDRLPIDGNRIDLRFKLPGRSEEVRVSGEVVQVSKRAGGYGAHVRFGEMDLETQRAIARFIDARTTAQG